jgi:aryl-phospho-beta-D-glucosidase BglC (GH1 family)
MCLSLIPAISSGTNPLTIAANGTVTYPGGLPRLYVEGKIIRNENEPFFLVGCNVRGQAYNPKTDGKYDDWYSYRYQDADNIKSYGFNTIRLVTYWECIEISNSPSEFSYDENYIDLIQQTVEAYNEKGIYVIIDLHEHGSSNELGKFVPTLGSDTDFADAFYSDASPTSAREHLKRLWLKLSENFKDISGVAGYDLCNEPHRSSGPLSFQQVADYWFDIADYVISALRDVGDNHIVFVNFSPWARYAGFMSRKLNDDNVLYSPHFYQGHGLEAQTVAYNDYVSLQNDFENDINSKMTEFNVPFVMEEQGFGVRIIIEGDEYDIWLKNSITIHKTNPNMQGWLYWCYIAYGGVMSGGGWQTTLMEYVADKPI